MRGDFSLSFYASPDECWDRVHVGIGYLVDRGGRSDKCFLTERFVKRGLGGWKVRHSGNQQPGALRALEGPQGLVTAPGGCLNSAAMSVLFPGRKVKGLPLECGAAFRVALRRLGVGLTKERFCTCTNGGLTKNVCN